MFNAYRCDTRSSTPSYIAPYFVGVYCKVQSQIPSTLSIKFYVKQISY